MGLYDGQAWAKLAKEAGFIPEDTETQARSAFRFCAGRIKTSQDLLTNEKQSTERLRSELEDLRMFLTSTKNKIEDQLNGSR